MFFLSTEDWHLYSLKCQPLHAPSQTGAEHMVGSSRKIVQQHQHQLDGAGAWSADSGRPNLTVHKTSPGIWLECRF